MSFQLLTAIHSFYAFSPPFSPRCLPETQAVALQRRRRRRRVRPPRHLRPLFLSFPPATPSHHLIRILLRVLGRRRPSSPLLLVPFPPTPPSLVERRQSPLVEPRSDGAQAQAQRVRSAQCPRCLLQVGHPLEVLSLSAYNHRESVLSAIPLLL